MAFGAFSAPGVSRPVLENERFQSLDPHFSCVDAIVGRPQDQE